MADIDIEDSIARELEESIAQVCARLGLCIEDQSKKKAAKAATKVVTSILTRKELPIGLPPAPPEKYVSRPKVEGRKESIIDFLRRVWKPWMDANLLTRADLRRLDSQADTALENWMQRYGDLPDDINILVYKRVLRRVPTLSSSETPAFG